VAAALAKIAEHIGSAKKFRRAAPLLRQLLQDGKVQRRHADLLFTVRSPGSSPVCQGGGGPSASARRLPCTRGGASARAVMECGKDELGVRSQRIGAHRRLSSSGVLHAPSCGAGRLPRAERTWPRACLAAASRWAWCSRTASGGRPPRLWQRRPRCVEEMCRLPPIQGRLPSSRPCGICTHAVSWQALCAAMREPERAVDPALTNEYQKLFTAASKCAEVQTLIFRTSVSACC